MRRLSPAGRLCVALLAILASGQPLSRVDAAPAPAAGDASWAADPSRDCVEADVGSDHASSLGCLNQRFKHMADQAHAAPTPAAPLGAGSPPNAIGLANDAAAAEQMGSAFGKSNIPQRPHLNFSNPLLQSGSH
jgi:hypothetical protein